MPENVKKPVLVAAIAGAFGVKGEVRLKSFTQDPAACLTYAPFLDKDGVLILSIKRSRTINGGFAVFAHEVDTREQAEALKSTKLYVLRSNFTEPDEGDFYQADLLDLRAETEDGKPLGRIKAVLNFGASDLLEITGTPDVPKSWTIPFTRHHVPVVDIKAGKVVLHDAQEFIQPDEKAKPEEKGNS